MKKRRYLAIGTISMGIVFTGLLGRCEDSGRDNSELDSQLIETVESGMEEVAEGLASVNDSGGITLALTTPPSNPLQKLWHSSILQKLYIAAAPAKVYAAEYITGCVTTTRPSSAADLGESGVTEVDIVRIYEDCGRRLVRVNGSAYLEYSGLSDGLPHSGTVISRAPDVTRTHSVYGGFAHLRGASEETLQPEEDLEALPVAQRFTFDSFDRDAGTAQYTLESNARRNLYLDGDDSPHRSHLIGSDLTVERSGSSRTVNGTITIENETDGFTTTLTMTEVYWEVAVCYPVEGTITFEVTGTRAGEGTITLDADNPGDIPVEYTGDGEVSTSLGASIAAAHSGQLKSHRIRTHIRRRLRRARHLIRLAGCRN